MSGRDYDEELVTLYRKHAGRLRGFLINMGLPAEIADEVADDSFLRAVPYWHRVRTYDLPEAYIYTIARREGWSRMKALEHIEIPFSHRPDSLSEVPKADIADEVVEMYRLREALQVLPVYLREVVVLRYALQCSVAETAALLGVSVGTVKRYASDGLRSLRRQLNDE